MATLKIKDSDGTIKYLSVSGSGTVGDPYKPNQNMILKDADENTAAVDDMAAALVVVDSIQNQINLGNAYRFGGTSDVANGAAYLYVFTTPATPNEVHLRSIIDCELEATVELLEDVDTVVGGTAVTPRNVNRNSADASGITALDKVTSLDDTGAVELIKEVVASGNNIGKQGHSKDEFILKQSTTYALRVSNDSGSTNNVNIVNFCYITSYVNE